METQAKKKVAVLLAEGFEEIEALTVCDLMRRTDLEPRLIAVKGEPTVRGAHGIAVVPDGDLTDVSAHMIDALVLPGGLPGAFHLRDAPEVLDLIRAMDEKQKLIGAICAAPLVLEQAGVMQSRRGTSYPGMKDTWAFGAYEEEPVVVDGHIVTSRGPATAMLFTLALVESLLGKDKREAVARDVLWPMIEG